MLYCSTEIVLLENETIILEYIQHRETIQIFN